MEKKVLCTIADVDTGEILYSPRDFNKGGTPRCFHIGDLSFSGENSCKLVFDSFLRGVRQGRNLSLNITVRSYDVKSELPLFGKDVY